MMAALLLLVLLWQCGAFTWRRSPEVSSPAGAVTARCVVPECYRRPWGRTEADLRAVLGMLGFVETEQGLMCPDHARARA